MDIQAQFPDLVVPENKFSRGALNESEIPSSLPSLSIFHKTDHGIDISKLQNINPQKQMIIPSYLSDERPVVVGRVVGKEGYGRFVGLKEEQLIVEIDGDISIGSVFTVFENRSRRGKLLRFLRSGKNEIVVRGTIKIVSYLQDSLYSASILESLTEIFPGNSLFEGEPRVYDFSQKGPIGSGSGLIIGTPNESRIALSLGSLVYLNRGQKDGIREGDFFYILAKARKRAFMRSYKYEAFLGQLKVIHTTQNEATGIVVEARDQIYVGDRFTDKMDGVGKLDESKDHEVIEEDLQEWDGGEDLELDEELDLTSDDLGDYEEMGEDEDMEEIGEDEDMEEIGEDEDMEEIGEDEDMEEMGEDEDMEEMGEDEDMEEIGEDEDMEEIGGDEDMEEIGGDEDMEEMGEDEDMEEIGGDEDMEEMGEDEDMEEIGEDEDMEEIGGDEDMEEMREDEDMEEMGEDEDMEEIGEDEDMEEMGEENGGEDSGFFDDQESGQKQEKDDEFEADVGTKKLTAKKPETGNETEELKMEEPKTNKDQEGVEFYGIEP